MYKNTVEWFSSVIFYLPLTKKQVAVPRIMACMSSQGGWETAAWHFLCHASSHSIPLLQAGEGRQFSHAVFNPLGERRNPLELRAPECGRCVAAPGRLCFPLCNYLVLFLSFVPYLPNQDLSCFSSEPLTPPLWEELLTHLCLFRHFILKYPVSGVW